MLSCLSIYVTNTVSCCANTSNSEIAWWVLIIKRSLKLCYDLFDYSHAVNL